MNTKTIVAVMAFVCAFASFGLEYRQLTKDELELLRADAQKLSPEDKAKRTQVVKLYQLLRDGGRMKMPGTPSGKIRIVNLQKRVASSDIKTVKKVFGESKPYDLDVVDADCKADVKITLIDDANSPSLAVYPDEGRAVVNVAKLADGKTKEKPAFLVARVRKEIVRAFVYMTAGSTYGTPVFNRMANAAALDDCAVESMPMDVIMRSSQYLAKVGVVPEENVSYKQVIKRGFDIAPTNDFQKAIYEQVKKVKADEKNAKK